MNDNLEIFKKHFKAELETINSDYNYKVELFTDIEKKNVMDANQVLLVITPMPSRSYGDGAITQQIEIKAMCHQKAINDIFAILTLYQNNVVNKKYFEENIMINESWYSPSIQENFVEYDVHKGATILMTGSVTFTSDVVDVEYVEIFGSRIKVFDFFESFTSEPLPNETLGSKGRKKMMNRSSMLKIDFKCKNAKNMFCISARKIRNGEYDKNIPIPIKIVYTDGDFEQYTMIIASQVFNANEGIPTLTVSLMEKL